MTKETADRLQPVETISDLEGKSQDLTLYGTPECRQRLDCKLGLEQVYGLKFKKFVPVDIALRHEVLTKGQADVSIVFTTDPQNKREGFVLLEDDQGMFPPYNSTLVVRNDVIEQAGPDLESTVEMVNEGLTDEVMQELNARVDLDKETPADVAAAYLEESAAWSAASPSSTPARPHRARHPAVEPAHVLLAEGQAVGDQRHDEERVGADLPGLGEVPDAEGEDPGGVQHDTDHEQARDALHAVPVAEHEECREHRQKADLEADGEYPLELHDPFIYIRCSI